MNKRKCLDDEKYTKLRKKLLAEKGSGLQREFLKAARSDEQFIDFIRNGRGVGTQDDEEVSILREKLTEHEYKEPPKDTEHRMYAAWKDIPPETACSVTFWGEVTLRHIEAGRIQSSYLAANEGSLSGGLARIDKAFSSSDSAKEVDACVRTVLRRMSGLPEARGNVSVYVNCPFGRAWWRGRWTEEVCENTGASRHDVVNLLRHGQEYWEKLVRLVISRNSVLGDQQVRDVLIWSLAEILESDKENAILKAKNLEGLCRLLGIRCAWQELGMLEVDELKALIDKEIKVISN